MKHCNPTNCAKTCNKFVADKKQPEFCKHWDIAGDWDKDRYTGVNGVCTLGKKRDTLTVDNRPRVIKKCVCGADLDTDNALRQFCQICRIENAKKHKQTQKEKKLKELELLK